MEPTGQTVTIWTARLAALLYVCWIARIRWSGEMRARAVSALALGVYLMHVGCAFQFVYQWSHEVAYRETARQTAGLFGVAWGGGVYLNYLFTLIWLGDCAASWAAPARWTARPAWLRAGVHAFLAFMWINASVVVWILRALR